METDIPLKILASARAADLLPLLGAAGSTLVGVESLELSAGVRRIDTLLRLVSPGGQRYRHLVEWQGYRDPLLLWRGLEYLARLGPVQLEEEGPLLLTLVYVDPKADVGDTLTQTLDGREVTAYRFDCVRLWQQDASLAVASGLPGLAALSPLMGGADAALMERAAKVVLEGMAPGQAQGDLLNALGIFGAGLIEAGQFERLIGKERLMSSSLMEYLYKDKLADVEREHAAERAQLEREREQREREREQREREREREQREREREQREREREQREQREQREREREQGRVRQAVADAVSARFPQAPIAVVMPLQQVRDTERLYQILQSVLRVPDQPAAEETIREAARE